MPKITKSTKNHQKCKKSLKMSKIVKNAEISKKMPKITKNVKLLECPIPLSSSSSSVLVTKNPDHFCSCCISQTWSNGFLQSFKQYFSPPDFDIS